METRNYDYLQKTINEIRQDEYFSEYVRNILSKDLMNSEISNIFFNAAKILNECGIPEGKNSQSKTGIIIGKVQSGKTSNFLATAALAFDNGYNLVVILGGTKNKLLEQNSERIREYFPEEKVIVINSYEDQQLLNAENIVNFIKRSIKVILVLLKKPERIKELAVTISTDELLKKEPIIIFDDEGDEASLNNLVSKGKMSKTYESILELKKAIEYHTFLSITATPQANLLITALDELSPDFGFLLEPGIGYSGLESFHGIDEKKYCIQIDDDEADVTTLGFTPKLKSSLLHFFVGAAIYKYTFIDKKKIKYSMLIHTSLEKKDHFEIEKIVKEEISNYKKIILDKDDYTYENFKNELINTLNNFSITFKGSPKFEDIEELVFEVINFCHINVLNDTTKTRSGHKPFEFNIFIGGNVLGRGLTLPNLGITFIVRTAKGKSNVDTTLQRARWFGYKDYYIGLCRIFATEKILEHFRIIREHEIDLWDTINFVKTQGKDFKKTRKLLTLSSKMNVTRGPVANIERYTFNSWNVERSFLADTEKIKSNLNAIDSFYLKHNSKLEEFLLGKKKQSVFNFLNSISFEEFNEYFLKNFLVSEKSDSFIKEKVQKLIKYIQSRNLDIKVDLLKMRSNTTSKHEIHNGRIPEYMVGKNPGDLGDYKGDRYHFNGENILFQIHYIEDLRTGLASPTLAFYIPNSIFTKLTDIIIGEG